MPRRPVKPQDRQRVARACESCKTSKKRCDGFQPCKACEKKGHSESCEYTAGRRNHPLPRRDSASSRIRTTRPLHLSPVAHGNGDNAISSSSRESWSTGLLSADSIGDTFEDSGRRELSEVSEDNDRYSSSEALTQPPVMLTSTSGDKVFIGNTAAISFLRFLQKTLEHYVGPSGFTAAQESQSLFEADTIERESSHLYDELSLDDRKLFAHSFLDASSGLLDLFSWDDVVFLLETHHACTINIDRLNSQQTIHKLDVASLYLMVAIGAQCCCRSTDDVAWAAKLFSFARKLALERMLENPSLELVRTFLLMAFYMLGACRRNSAFMYLGVASKAADILGLHVSAQYKHLSPNTRSIRLRTAKSLRVFDVVCNSILGRPSTSPLLRQGCTNYLNTDVDFDPETIHRALSLGATYEITGVLDAAVAASSDAKLDAEVAEKLVLDLQQRSRSFPAALRGPQGLEVSNTRGRILGNTHVSAIYYFGVIISTRQFLIQHIVPQLSNQDQSEPEFRDSHQHSNNPPRVGRLADACIEAATFMADMCHEIMQSGQLLGNMCIMKAWLFATGLVLGFSLLVEDSKRYLDRRAAFLKSLHVLKYLKRLSPQAEQYFQILSKFHVAIKAYKERTKSTQKAGGGLLVDRVFLPDLLGNLEGEPLATQLPSPDVTLDDFSIDWCNDPALDIISDPTAPVDPMLFGENDIILRMLWDSDRCAANLVECDLQSPIGTL